MNIDKTKKSLWKDAFFSTYSIRIFFCVICEGYLRTCGFSTVSCQLSTFNPLAEFLTVTVTVTKGQENSSLFILPFTQLLTRFLPASILRKMKSRMVKPQRDEPP